MARVDPDEYDVMRRAVVQLQNDRRTDVVTITDLHNQLRTATDGLTAVEQNLIATRTRLDAAENALRAAGGAPPVHAGGAPGGAQPKPPRPFDQKFEAKESDDWLTFRGLFENYVLTQGFDDLTAKRILKGSMRGVAYLAISQIDHERRGTDLPDMLGHYERKFLPPAASAMAQAKFDSAVQQPKETILQWHGRLYSLWMRAYPMLLMNHELPIRRFAAGLRKTRIRDQVLRARPGDFDAALEAAHAEQSIVDSGHLLLGQFPSQTGQGGGAEPMEIGAIDGNTKCFSCHKMGHIARECPQGAPSTSKSGIRAVSKAPSREKKKKTSGKPTKPTTGGNWKDKDRRTRFRRLIHKMDDLFEDTSESEASEEEVESEDSEAEATEPPKVEKPKSDF
jgi:hypothetical protein